MSRLGFDRGNLEIMTKFVSTLKKILAGQYAPNPNRGAQVPPPERWEADEVAKLTDWGPNQQGGSNIQTHKLKHVTAARLEFVPTTGFLLILSGLFCPVGIMAFVAGIILLTGNLGGEEQIQSLWYVMFGVFLVAIGGGVTVGAIWALVRARKPFVIDTHDGFLWKGNEKLVAAESPLAHRGLDRRIPLEEVHAVQLIREFIQPDRLSRLFTTKDESKSPEERQREIASRTYDSFEINLVLKSGDRITLTDHSLGDEIADQGKMIARFLEVPLWSMI